jgi:hypothetical protein
MVVDPPIKFKFPHAVSSDPFIFQLQENLFYQLRERLEKLTLGTITLILAEESWKNWKK